MNDPKSNKPKRIGRPPKPPSMVKAGTVVVRFTKDELANIDRLAGERGRSEFVRKAVAAFSFGVYEDVKLSLSELSALDKTTEHLHDDALLYGLSWVTMIYDNEEPSEVEWANTEFAKRMRLSVVDGSQVVKRVWLNAESMEELRKLCSRFVGTPRDVLRACALWSIDMESDETGTTQG